MNEVKEMKKLAPKSLIVKASSITLKTPLSEDLKTIIVESEENNYGKVNAVHVIYENKLIGMVSSSDIFLSHKASDGEKDLFLNLLNFTKAFFENDFAR